jgi:DNA processing protein
LKSQHLEQKIALTMLNGIGRKKAAVLVSKMGGIEAVFGTSLKTIQHETGFRMDLLKTMNRKLALEEAKKQCEFIVKHNIQTHFFTDTNYPRRLRQCADAPLLLYSKGKFDPNPSRTIAVVGTRSASDYGKSLCEELIDHFIGTNIQVVSGMAYGIDIIAHQACVRKGIETIGVLGHGLDRVYPALHRKTADQMLENGGMLTEFLPGTRPDRENFPMRNRIVAGMSDATIVVESKASGGSLITADMALDYNRDVFAFPGNVGQSTSEGCNFLIRSNKAQLITCGADLMKEMSWETNKAGKEQQQRINLEELSSDEKEIVEFLEDTAQHIDVISVKLKRPVSQISVTLLMLEIKGIIKSNAGNKYSVAFN